MKDEAKKVLSKDQLKAKLDELGDEIKYRVEEAKKSGASIGGAHKTDIGELMKDYRIMKEAYGRILNTEKESLQLEDILSTLAEEKGTISKNNETKYGHGVLIQFGNLNCQYIMYQCPTEPNKNNIIEQVRFINCSFIIFKKFIAVVDGFEPPK